MTRSRFWACWLGIWALSAVGAEATEAGKPSSPWLDCVAALQGSETPGGTLDETLNVEQVRLRFAALEFLFKNRERRTKIEPGLLALLDRIAAGEADVLKLAESAPYQNVIREEIPEASLFLKRMAREANPLTEPKPTQPDTTQKKLKDLLKHRQKTLGGFKKFGMELGIGRMEFDRFDAFVAELKSYPRPQDRLAFFRAAFSSLGPVTWPEMLTALEWIESKNRRRAVGAARSQIFTPQAIYSPAVMERIEEVSRASGEPVVAPVVAPSPIDLGPADPLKQLGAKLRRYALMGVVGTAIAGGGGYLAYRYFSPELVVESSGPAQLGRNLREEQRAWSLIAEGSAQFRSSQEFGELTALAREEALVRYAAGLAPMLGIPEYSRVLDTGLANPTLRWSLWVHYLKVNSGRLSLDEVVELTGEGLRSSRQPTGTAYELSSVYADYVLAHPEQTVEWWIEAIGHAPDFETGDGLAFACIKLKGASLTPEQSQQVVRLVKNPTTRDRALSEAIRQRAISH